MFKQGQVDAQTAMSLLADMGTGPDSVIESAGGGSTNHSPKAIQDEADNKKRPAPETPADDANPEKVPKTASDTDSLFLIEFIVLII